MSTYQSRTAYRLSHVPDLYPNQNQHQQTKHRQGSKSQTGVYITSRVRHATARYQQSLVKKSQTIFEDEIDGIFERITFRIMPAPTSTSGSVRRKGRQGSLDEYAGTGLSRRSSNATGDQHPERGWMMRDQMWEDDEESTGKAGGVGMGVTRPKRRLSRAMSQSVSSPPLSPGRGKGNNSASGPHEASSTYQALSNNLSAGGGGAASSSTDHNVYRNHPTLRMDEKLATGAGGGGGGSGGYSATPVQAIRSDGTPRIFGIELKWISLITLALQNAFLTIIMHYSRISASPDKTYSAAAAVLLNELLKGSISVLIALRKIDHDLSVAAAPAIYGEKESRLRPSPRSSRLPTLFHSSRLRVLTKSIFSPDCYTLAVPAILYVIQNNLQYVAASNLDVATFQVTYQMKILTTAFFSVFILRKRLSRAKWLALVLLAVGVGIVQIQTTSAPAHSSSAGIDVSGNEKGAASAGIVADERVMHPFKGFMAVTAACLTSGLAGVYFEFILKGGGGGGPAPDLWIRNTQLSLFSLVPALVPILVSPAGAAGTSWFERVFATFSNFNGWAIGTVLTQTFGGLITAVVIRYSDNIMKGFATSISIVLSFLASVALFNYPITLAFCIGSSIVLAATYLYNAPAPAHSNPRTTIGVDPGSPISHTAPILGEPERPSRASSFVSLLGLGGGSNASSRKPSATDLRTHFAGSSGGFTQVSPNMGNANGSVMGLYAAVPTDGVYMKSANHSDSSLAEKRSAQGL